MRESAKAKMHSISTPKERCAEHGDEGGCSVVGSEPGEYSVSMAVDESSLSIACNSRLGDFSVVRMVDVVEAIAEERLKRLFDVGRFARRDRRRAVCNDDML